MAWWVKKDISYLGPGFDWIDRAEVPATISGGGLSVSRTVDPSNVPRVARARGPCKGPPRQNIFLVDVAVVCKPALKKLVESVEPGVHLFVPIDLQYADGTEMEGDFYYFNCQTDIDCILTQNRTEWFRQVRTTGEYRSEFGLIQKLTPIDIQISKPQVSGHHLWTAGVLGWNNLLISDEFYQICKKAKFRAWEYWRYCEEVDVEWRAEDNMGPLLPIWRDYVASGRTMHIPWI